MGGRETDFFSVLSIEGMITLSDRHQEHSRFGGGMETRREGWRKEEKETEREGTPQIYYDVWVGGLI